MEDLRKYFLKKDQPGKKERDEKKEGRERRQREAKEKTELATDEEDTGGDPWKKITHKDDAARPLFDPKTEITGELVVKKLHEINASRGRKSTNRKTHVKYLEELYKITDDNKLGAGILAKILCSVISALFELNTRISDAMDFKSWSRTLETVRGLYTMLVENQNVQISISVTEDDENLTSAEKPYRMHGSIVLLVKRLDDELTKIFQNADCHSTDYIEKLKGERELCSLIEQAQEFVDSHRSEGWFDPDEVATIYMLRIEHAHYKFAPENDNGETERLLDDLCKVVYSLKNAMKQRQRAMLCQIYHHAIHDRWHKAKDLLLMSHLQALADHSDASTQILYNRAICQVGLCAFRHGFIREAHQSLSEIQNTQRAKELLAQGTPPRQLDKTAEQETKERSMQVPYHMHINLELMECVYLICSMLLEIPNIACHEYDVRRRLLSRSFHYQLKFSEKSALIGPPENTREHVVAASRAMLKGDWRKCRDYIINDKMNAKVWNLFRNSPKVKEMVIQRIQEETLRTYLLMYTTIYNTVSLDTLCELFELKRQRVYAIISKMIIQEELSATLDEPTNCLIMHRIEPSRLQLLALSLTDKLAQLADNNEQIIEPRGTRTGYTVPGSWYAPRQDRGADDKNRRAVGGMFQGDRRGYGQDNQKRNWNSSNQQRRRGDMKRY
jgi:translation initiation factor 3 subunit C